MDNFTFCLTVFLPAIITIPTLLSQCGHHLALHGGVLITSYFSLWMSTINHCYSFTYIVAFSQTQLPPLKFIDHVEI